MNSLRRFLIRAAPLAAAVTLAAAAPAERVFFAFDDHSIPWHDNLQFTLVPATKHPANPVLRAGPPGAPDHGHAILYGTVLHDGAKFRMWYLGMPDTSFEAWRQSRWRPMCYAESDDGVVWRKPELGLVEVNGSRRNNACLVESPDFFLTRVDDFISVLHDPADPDPQRRFKCAFIAHIPSDKAKGGLRDLGDGKGVFTANEEGRVGVKQKAAAAPRIAMMVTATSADGLRWRVVGDRPAVDEKLEVSGLWRFGDFYYAAGQQITPWTWRADGTEVGRAAVVYRSADFVTWSPAKARSFIRAGQHAATPLPGQQTHMGAGVWDRGNVLVGLHGLWQDGPKEKPKGAPNLLGTTVDLGLVVSNDGIRFREPVPDFKVISRGRPGEWDDTALLQGHAFANRGDETLIWYSHWDTGGQLRNMHIGLATLRRDGFGHLARRNRRAPGHFVTAAAPLPGGVPALAVNVDGATAAAPLTLELLDARDRPVPGFSGADAARITTSGTRVAVTWPRPGRLAAGTACSIKATLPAAGDVRVYALYLPPAP